MRLLSAAVLCIAYTAGITAAPPRAKNVLLVGVDDLRPDISGPYVVYT